MYHRTQCQWNMLLDQVFHWEDIAANENNRDRIFRSTFMQPRSLIMKTICVPKIGNCLILNFLFNIFIFYVSIKVGFIFNFRMVLELFFSKLGISDIVCYLDCI